MPIDQNRKSKSYRGMTRVAAAALAVLFSLAFASPSVSALSPAESLASKAGNQAIRAAWAGGSKQAKTAAFLRLIKRYSNIRSVARNSLGPYRRKLPRNRAAEYDRLVAQFTARVFANYASSFAGREIEVVRSRPRGKRFVVVDSRIVYNGGRRASPVKWLVYNGKRKRVADVNIQGVWLSAFIRQKFISILRKSKGDFDPLFAFLRQ